MRGNDEILELLNEVLSAELTAVNQYFAHAKIMQDWGYLRLAKKKYEESIEEMKHADDVIKRILYFDGIPNYVRYFPLKIGETVPEMFQCDLELEYAAIERLNRGIAVCREKGDNGTRDLLEQILVSEEEHIDWLEAQQDAIEQVGVENYLAQHLHG